MRYLVEPTQHAALVYARPVRPPVGKQSVSSCHDAIRLPALVGAYMPTHFEKLESTMSTSLTPWISSPSLPSSFFDFELWRPPLPLLSSHRVHVRWPKKSGSSFGPSASKLSPEPAPLHTR